MSGWIKIEKDLETDPRVLRMAKNLDRLFITFNGGEAELDPCNAVALPSVTLVCGALTRLWVYADSHIRDDDTLDMGCKEIDEWLGIPGFCTLMPDDWLTEMNECSVELPGFQSHNGVEAKKKALTQKRVAQHRLRTQRKGVTDSNASALPDQTTPRPDQTKTRPKKERANGAVVENLILHESLPETEWTEWLTHRRAKRWPCDALTLRKQLELLAGYTTPQQRDMINTAIRSGWQGVFPPKIQNGTALAVPKRPAKSVAELEAEEAARAEH